MKNFISILILYRKAISFESLYEKKYFKIFNIKGYQSLIPRSLALQPFLSKIDPFFRLIFPFFYLLWIFLMPLIFILKSIFFFIRPVKKIKINENAVYLNTSNPSNLNRVNTKFETIPKVSLHYRKRHTGFLNEMGISSYHIFDTLNKSNIIISLLYSLVFHFYIILRKPEISLFSYSSFEFFSTLQAIGKIKNLESLWISNQFDRWVILPTFFYDKEIVIVQHGNLKYKHDDHNEVIFKLDNKIRGISKVYCINEDSEALFKKFLNSNSIEYIIMKKLQSLKTWRKQDKETVKILINIGYDDISFYKKIVDNLIRQCSNIDIGITYHPLQKNRINIRDIWEIKNSNSMPKPNIYLSYGSSLDEYFEDNPNIKTIIYNKELIKTADNVTTKILKHIGL